MNHREELKMMAQEYRENNPGLSDEELELVEQLEEHADKDEPVKAMSVAKKLKKLSEE